MPVIIAALVGLALVAVGLYWFVHANPSNLAKRARLTLIVVAAFVALGLLLVSLPVLPSILPELFGLAGVVITALIARAARRRTSGNFSTPGTGRRSAVRTPYLDAWIDHDNGEMGASVLQGRFAGRTLDGLSDSEAVDLHGECASDPDSRKILESYLDRRLGPDWRQSGHQSGQQSGRRQDSPRGPRVDMTHEEALAVLGLQAGAGEEEIKAAHRRLIQRMHPDVGGSADLAARINRAKDVLLGQ